MTPKSFARFILLITLTAFFAVSGASALNPTPNLLKGWDSYLLSAMPSSQTYTNLQTGNNETEASEPTLPCRIAGEGQGTYSAWVRVNHPGGTLSVSTVGSNYDTVLAIFPDAYKREDIGASVACNDDISADTRQSQLLQTLPSAAYLILVVQSGTGVPVDGLTLSIALNYTPDGTVPINDSITGATVLQANKPSTTLNGHFATDDTLENSLKACRITTGVWYEFTATTTMLIRASGYGSQTRLREEFVSPLTRVAIYTSSDNTPTGTLTLKDCVDEIYTSISEDIILSENQKVYIHVGVPDGQNQNLLADSFYVVKVTPLVQGLLKDPSIDTLEGWKTVNFAPEDTVTNGILTINAGALRKTLSQTVAFPLMTRVTKSSYIFINYGYINTIEGAKIVYTITYKNGTKRQKTVVPMTTSNELQGGYLTIVPTSRAIASFKVQVIVPPAASGATQLISITPLFIRDGLERSAAPQPLLPFPHN